MRPTTWDCCCLDSHLDYSCILESNLTETRVKIFSFRYNSDYADCFMKFSVVVLVDKSSRYYALFSSYLAYC